tara:strand:+ start:7393 stop:7752 length:360 start_codon:yes stop_codon:yes gene_type:complete
MQVINRDITDIQRRFLAPYLEKSKDSLEEFLEGDNNREISEWEDWGWVEYTKFDDVLWIWSSYAIPGKQKDSQDIWKKLKDLAKKSGCKKIQFSTRRNPKAWERLYGAKVVQYKMEVVL